jgi:hypothetical protein
VLIADVVNAGQRHIALHIAWHSLLYAWHARAQQVVVLPRPAQSGWWMLARPPVVVVEWFVDPLDAGRRWEDGRVGTLLGRCERAGHVWDLDLGGLRLVDWWRSLRGGLRSRIFAIFALIPRVMHAQKARHAGWHHQGSRASSLFR